MRQLHSRCATVSNTAMINRSRDLPGQPDSITAGTNHTGTTRKRPRLSTTHEVLHVRSSLLVVPIPLHPLLERHAFHLLPPHLLDEARRSRPFGTGSAIIRLGSPIGLPPVLQSPLFDVLQHKTAKGVKSTLTNRSNHSSKQKKAKSSIGRTGSTSAEGF